MTCVSVVIEIYRLQGLLATDPWGDSYIGCGRRVPSVHPDPDDLYGRVSDRVFPKGHVD